MIAFQQTRLLVVALLYLSGSPASAQTDTTAAPVVAELAVVQADQVFRLIMIGGQPLLVAQDSYNTSGDSEETIPDHCLVTLLNFFLEVPPPKQ
jgi:hypothetical protein